MAKKKKEVTTKTCELVYLYSYCSAPTAAKRKKLYVYTLIGDLHKGSESAKVWDKPLNSEMGGKCLTIGGVYLCKYAANSERFSVFGNCKFLRTIEDKEIVVKWTTTDTAEKAIYDQWKVEQSAKRRNRMYETLDPIKNAMGRTNAIGRRAIVAAVLEYLYH